jgi:hypothetical protein
MATVTRTGVKYIKVSKTDALGNNYDNSWRLNDSIKLNYSDIGVKEYIVNTITEYSNYWLLGLDYVDVTSSLQGAKDYKVQATKKITSQTFNAGQSSSVTGYTEVVNTQGFFNPTNGLYGQGNTINIPLTVTASFFCDTTSGNKAYPFIRLIFTNEAGVSLGESPVLEYVYTGGATEPNLKVTLTGSFVPQYSNGIYYKIEVGNSASAVHKVDVTGGNTEFNLLITQSVAPASNTLTILNPFFTSPFEGTDCDVTYGWIQSYPYSQYYMDVDYSDSATIPINQQALISGTATPALVNDYYYQTRRHTYPRYVGSRVIGQVINEYTDGDISYGKDPVINVGQAYFSYFNYIYGVSPEINGVIAADIKYTIDQLGNIYSPGIDSELVNTLKQNYPEGSKASVKLIGETNQAMSTYLNREFTVYRAGAKVKPIIYSQTSSLGFTGSIRFNPTAGSPKSYKLAAGQIGTYTVNANTSQFPYIFGDEAVDDSTYYNNATGVYEFGASPLNQIKFDATVEVTNTSTISNSTVQLLILKNDTIPLANILYTLLPGESNKSLTAAGGYASFLKDDTVKVKLSNLSNNNVTSTNGYFQANQLGFSGSASTTTPFFSSGSSPSSSVLTCSLDLFRKAGYPQADITSSGFNPIVDNFTFQIGDQLRFENDETKVHTIASIGNPTTSYGPTLTITPPLISGSNIDFFLLRRFDNSTNTVLLVGGKPSGGTSTGTLTPKYLSEALQKGTSAIIADLSSKNLI